MGQDQSQLLTDEQLDEAQIRRRQRDEMRSTKKKKPPVRSPIHHILTGRLSLPRYNFRPRVVSET